MPLMTKLHPRRDCDDGEEKHANIAGIFDEFFFAVHSVVKTKSWDIPTTSSFFFGWDGCNIPICGCFMTVSLSTVSVKIQRQQLL